MKGMIIATTLCVTCAISPIIELTAYRFRPLHQITFTVSIPPVYRCELTAYHIHSPRQLLEGLIADEEVVDITNFCTGYSLMHDKKVQHMI